MAKDSAWLCQLGGGWCGFGELCRYRGGKLDADCGGVAAWPHRPPPLLAAAAEVID